MCKNIFKTKGHVRSFISISLICLVGIFASACGGGGSSSGTDIAEGVFLDSTVEGLGYRSGDITGVTDVEGTFRYEVGQPISFFLGGIQLGTVTAKARMTPIDLIAEAINASHPAVINLLRFLQTIDSDNDPANGIQISTLTTEMATGLDIDFTLSVIAFADSGAVQTAVSELTGVNGAARELISEKEALDHFQTTLDFIEDNPLPNVLTLTGDDAATYGSELNLTEFAFGTPVIVGPIPSLIATNDGVLQHVLNGTNDPSVAANAIVFISSDVGISMRINVNGESGLYLMACVDRTGAATLCENIELDVDNRTITFTDTVVQPSTSSTNTLGTAPLTLNGTLAWTAADDL